MKTKTVLKTQNVFLRIILRSMIVLAMFFVVSCAAEAPEAPVEEPAEEAAEAPAEEVAEEEEAVEEEVAAEETEEAMEEEAEEVIEEEEVAEEEEEAMVEEEAMAEPPPVLDKVFYGDTWTWPYQPDLLAHMSRGRFFIPVQDEDKIAILDPDAEGYGLEFVTTDYVQPHHPWIAPGMRYNVINFQSEGKGDHDAMAVQDTWSGEIIKYINTGNNDPFHMAFSPTDPILVTADLDTAAGRVHIFDTETWEEIGQVETTGLRTRDITITHDGRYAFIGHNEYKPDEGVMGAMDVLDIHNQEIVASFGEGRCRSGKMSNGGDLVLYSCDRSDTVVVVDTATLEEVKRIEAPAGSGPFNISFRPDDKFAYVGLSAAGQLGIIDMETLEFVKTLDSGTNTNSTYIHPYAPLAVTTNDGSDTHVSIVDIENNEIIDQIEVGGKSSHNAQWSPDGRWMIVSNRGGDSLTLLEYNDETGTIEWVDDITVGFGANGVHWAPYFCGVDELTASNVATVENLPAIDDAGTCGSFDEVTGIPVMEEAEMAEAMEAPGDVLNKVFYGDTWTWPYQPDLLAHMSRGRFFIPVQDEDKIAILDPDAEGYGLEFVTTDYVQPHHPWIAPGMRYNVINFQSEGKGDHDAMAVQDTQTGEIIKYINTGNNDPFHMAFSPTDPILVTADLDTAAGRVHIFDTETWEEIGQVETTGLRTRDITITHDGRYAFIGHNEYKPDEGVMGAMDVLDIHNQEIVASFGEGRCRSGKMSNGGDLVLYSCDRSDTVVVVDTATLEEVKRIEAPPESGPFNISFRPDDKFAYVGLSAAGQLGIIDMETLEFVKTLDSGTNTNSTYIHPYAPLAVTTNDGTDTHVSIVDIENNEIIDQIEVGGKSSHNAQWSPDGRWMIVSNRGGDSLTLLEYNDETGTIEWVDDITVGFGANGVHWAPYFCGVDELTASNVDSVENLPMIDDAGTCGSFDEVTGIPVMEEAEMAEAMEAPGDVLNKVFYGDTWTWPYQPDLLAHMSRGRFFIPVQDEDKSP